MATLAVYRGEQLLRKVELGETPMRIGRAPENEIVLEDVNKGVSRMHAEIRYEDGRYIILDLNSQNGVWIREHRVRIDPLPVDVPVAVGPYRLVLMPTPNPSPSTSIPGTVISAVPGAQSVKESTARVEQVESAARTQQGPKTLPGGATAPSSGTNRRLLIAGVAVAALAAVAVLVMMMRRQPQAPPVETNPPIAQATTTVPPSGATDEQRFQDHFTRAQGLMEKGDKAGAASENAQALTILPSDPRGLKQRTDIEAMTVAALPAPTPVSAPPPAATPLPNAGKEKEPAPPSTLRVAARPNESAAERNNWTASSFFPSACASQPAAARRSISTCVAQS